MLVVCMYVSVRLYVGSVTYTASCFFLLQKEKHWAHSPFYDTTFFVHTHQHRRLTLPSPHP